MQLDDENTLVYTNPRFSLELREMTAFQLLMARRTCYDGKIKCEKPTQMNPQGVSHIWDEPIEAINQEVLKRFYQGDYS